MVLGEREEIEKTLAPLLFLLFYPPLRNHFPLLCACFPIPQSPLSFSGNAPGPSFFYFFFRARIQNERLAKNKNINLLSLLFSKYLISDRNKICYWCFPVSPSSFSFRAGDTQWG